MGCCSAFYCPIEELAAVATLGRLAEDDAATLDQPADEAAVAALQPAKNDTATFDWPADEGAVVEQ